MSHSLRFVRPRRLAVQAGLLCLIAATFAGSTYLSVRSFERLIDEDAQVTARQWADAFAVEDARLAPILAGEPVKAEDEAFFTMMATVGKVFRFKVFGPDGRLLMVSDALDQTGTASLQDHQPAIAAAIMNGHIHSEVRDGRAKPNRPDDYAEAYVPIMKGGRMQGVVEVYVDQTDKRARFDAELRRSVWMMLALSVLAITHTLYTASLMRLQHRSDARIRRLAHYDTLTGLANRAHFQEEAERLLAAQSEQPSRRRGDAPSIALHAIDLDGFKAINDALGHQAGDTLLRILGAQLADCLREGDVAARLGGDEFVVIQTNVAGAADVERLATRLGARIRAITDLDGVPVSVSASIGVAIAPDHATALGDLHKCADVALYHAKAHGRDRFAVFAAGMDEDLRARNALRMTLRQAVDGGAVELHYQPLHAASDGRLCSFEALARLPDGEGGYVSPTVFIPVAEDMGLMPKLGAFVLNEACRMAATWPEHLRVAVNLSPQQFEQDVVVEVRRALKASGLAPERLEVEITEGLFIEDPEAVQAQLNAIKALGVRVVMDDFGSGYSSLSYLWRFPFDKLKVDRSCLQQLGVKDNVAEVLRTISAMSQAMNLRVTVEGVETTTQRDFACEAGYDELQGFLFSHPLPDTDLAHYMLSDAASERRVRGEPQLTVVEKAASTRSATPYAPHS